jgi:hypothetical protein
MGKQTPAKDSRTPTKDATKPEATSGSYLARSRSMRSLCSQAAYTTIRQTIPQTPSSVLASLCATVPIARTLRLADLSPHHLKATAQSF